MYKSFLTIWFVFLGVCVSDSLLFICSGSSAGWTRYSLMGDPISGEHSLLIDSVDLEDDAVYECQATQAGLRSHRAKLTVLGKTRSSCQGWKLVLGGNNQYSVFIVAGNKTKMHPRAQRPLLI